jgi:hypothetical protein
MVGVFMNLEFFSDWEIDFSRFGYEVTATEKFHKPFENLMELSTYDVHKFNPRISMRLFNAGPLMLLIGVAVVFSSCTTHKETVNRYKYLIHEDNEENVATKTTSDAHEIIREKATSMNLGEKMVPVLEEASDYLGTPYKYGGTTKTGIDCSGLTKNCYARAGVALPRSAADQSQYGELVPREELQIGDLVFFDAKSSGKIDHVGMVTKAEGDNVIFIHSSTSKGVRFDYLNDGYWVDKLRMARRVPVQ